MNSDIKVTVDALRQIAAQLTEKINTANKELNDVKKQIAELTCPLSVGDHLYQLGLRGETTGVIGRVDKITPSRWSGEDWTLQVVKIKKNGEDYAKVSRFFQRDWCMKPIPESELPWAKK